MLQYAAPPLKGEPMGRHALRDKPRADIPREFRHSGARRRRDPDLLPAWLVTALWPLRGAPVIRAVIHATALALLAYPLR